MNDIVIPGQVIFVDRPPLSAESWFKMILENKNYNKFLRNNDCWGVVKCFEFR